MKTHFHVVPIYDDDFNESEYAVMLYVKYMNRNYKIKTYKSKQDARNVAYDLMCELETYGLAYFSLVIAGQEGYPVFDFTPTHFESESDYPF